MVAGWRLPFSADKDKKSSTVETAGETSTSPSSAGLEPAPAGVSSSDPRIRSIISAASGGASVGYDRPAPNYPLYAASGQAPEAVVANPSAASRSDPRLGSLSRHYRPRTAQFQRTRS